MINNTITIVQRRLTEYRVPLFNLMADQLAGEKIRLRLVYGRGTTNEAKKMDTGELSWAEQIPTNYFLGESVCWQPIRNYALSSDLLILPQENALLANHGLLLHRPVGACLAFWGHGANLQSPNRDSLRERYKRWTTRQVDWWFAYTEMSVGLVAETGFPRDRITCLNNATNVAELRALRASITEQETIALRASLGLLQGFTGIFLGSLYEEKRLDVLFAAADLIKETCPDFSLVVIGAGPQAGLVAAMAASRPWVRAVGMRQGREKALYLSLGDVLLSPGLVGLNILDSFATSLPIVTTDCGLHSPEVVYLDTTNGVMTADSVAAYAAACIRLARQPAELATLRLGCIRSANLYSIEKMAKHFTKGILAALEVPPLKRADTRRYSVGKSTSTQVLRTSIVTNIPAPYRSRVFSLLPSDSFHVIYCARKEPNRDWKLPALSYSHEFLKERIKDMRDGFNFRHNNLDVWSSLQRQKPDVVVTTGFNLTHLYAFIWAKFHRARHVCMTDGTIESESSLGWIHRMTRRLVFAGSGAFVAASKKGIALYLSYGLPRELIFQSYLCADNDLFSTHASETDRPFDVMFSGQLQERKLPFLFVDVCGEVLRRRGRCAALILGSGPLRDEVLHRLSVLGVEVTYPGFVQQAELPSWYSRARVLLFTTRMDPWGVVANEALAAGTPVICTSHAGVADELVLDGKTGFVCSTETLEWADAAVRLLDDAELWERFSRTGRELVANYNYQAASYGIQAACSSALKG